jgi:hypothetical protein
MAGSRGFLRTKPGLTWGLGIFLAFALILGFTTVSRFKGTPQAYSYMGRHDRLKQQAEALGLLVDPAKYVAPRGEGPNGADLIREAGNRWERSNKGKGAQLRLSADLELAAECSWVDPGGFESAVVARNPSMPYLYLEFDNGIKARIEEGDYENALADIELAFELGKPRPADSFGRWLADRMGWQVVALHRTNKLAAAQPDDAVLQKKLRTLVATHPFKVDLRKEFSSVPGMYLAVFDMGDYRANTRVFEPCVNFLQTPDPCAMERIDWDSFRKALEARAYEVWMQQLKDIDDLWKTTENTWTYELAEANSPPWDTFQECAHEMHPSQFILLSRMTEVMVKEQIVTYFLARVDFKAKHRRWPTASEVPLPEDPWTKKPLLSTGGGDKVTVWSVGPDRHNNRGADIVNGSPVQSLERDVRLDYPPLPGKVILNLTDNPPVMDMKPGDRVLPKEGS